MSMVQLIKKFLVFAFVVRVAFPMGAKYNYDNVERIDWISSNQNEYCLVLTGGKRVWVPTMWTIIEEK